MVATSFWHPNDTPMSAQQLTKALVGKLPEFSQDEDELRAIWSRPDTRRKSLKGLADTGLGKEQQAGIQKIIDTGKSGPFDVLAHVASAITDLGQPEERIGHAFAEYQMYLYQGLARAA